MKLSMLTGRSKGGSYKKFRFLTLLRKRKISFTPTTLTLNMMKLKNPFMWQARK